MTGNRTRAISFLLIWIWMITAGARADLPVLPLQLEIVEEEAFANNMMITEVVLPDTIVSVDDRAFSGCGNLARIYIPGTVQSLGEDILQGCADDVLILSEPEGIALDYALTNRIDFRGDTRYRALMIAQSYDDIPRLKLEGPENDVAAFSSTLKQYTGTPYEVEIRRNLTASGICRAIEDAFGDAEPQDVSLLYYSGHGVTTGDKSRRGALLGVDGISSVTSDELRALLDRIPGRKILMIDACCSGNLLQSPRADSNSIQTAKSTGSTGQETGGPEEFADLFTSSFTKRGRGGTVSDDSDDRRSRGSLGGDHYFILTAAAENELCYEAEVGGKDMGLFTATMLQGCGYPNGEAPADANQNGVLTLNEIFCYTYTKMLPEGQHVQVYPEGCSWLGIFRKE